MARTALDSPHIMRRAKYIWEQPGWPHFTWNDKGLLEPPAAAQSKNSGQNVLKIHC